MSNTVEEAIAGAEESPVGKKVSEQDYILRRQAALGGSPAKEAPKAEEEKPKDEASPEGNDAKPEAEAPASDDVLSKAKSGNLDSLTDEEIDQLAKTLGSKAVARYGELTAKRKQAEEEAARLRAALAAKEQEKPQHEPIANNPFASLKTSEELEAKAREVKQSIEVLEEIVENSDGLGAEDVVGTGPNGESYTKKQVKEKLRAARKARDEFLPDVAQRIQKREQARQMRSALEGEARKQIPWLEDEKDERVAKYKAMVGDERLKRLEEVLPDVAAQMPFLLAHAANSMFGRREIAVDAGSVAPIKPKPPASPVGSSAASGRPDTQSKHLNELKARAAATGSTADWTALRTAKLSGRKTL